MGLYSGITLFLPELLFVMPCNLYGLLQDGRLHQQKFKDTLDTIVDAELGPFYISRSWGSAANDIDSSTLQKIIARFPGSVYELVSRSIKDILADTHPEGLLSHLHQRETGDFAEFLCWFS